MTYGNGLQIKYVYDALDRISEVQYNVGEGGAFKTVYTYTYDAWGNCTVSATEGISATEDAILEFFNPFRYRGYYYDVETGLYYLQSRYLFFD